MSDERITVLQYIAKSAGNESGDKVKKLEETITKIEYLTGYPINELIGKLETGWELRPPVETYSLTDLVRYKGNRNHE